MLEIAIYLVLIAAFALFMQQRAGVPTPITIISTVVAIKLVGYTPFTISDATFDQMVYLMLPILLCVDAMALRWDELKKNALSLFYIAGVMIILSVGMAILVNRHILPDYELTAPMVAALFCMFLATDPVSVSAVFGRAKLPHNLKVLAEGESLFNDASALLVFSIALMAMGYGPTHIESTTVYAMKMIFGSVVVGVVSGYMCVMLLKHIHDAMTETMIVLLLALGVFAFAEHYHVSGIISVVVAVLFANHIITKGLVDTDSVNEKSATEKKKFLRRILLNYEEMTKDNTIYQVVKGNIQFLGIIAATILFATMATVVDLTLLMDYKNEIIAVFIGSTIIRMIMLGGFAWLSKKTTKVVTIHLHWWKILTAAGVKGAFSLLMLHMIPKTFQYIELFTAIVIGNVLLTTFIYPIAMMIIVKAYSKEFEAEYEAEHSHD